MAKKTLKKRPTKITMSGMQDIEKMTASELLSPNTLKVFGDAPMVADDANPKDALGDAKVDLALNPPAASIYMALGFMEGARKYGPYNWRTKKVKMMVYLSAAKRHIDKIIDGQDIDEESFKPEIGHALASLGIIADAMETGNLIDNRPPPGAAAKLLQKWKAPVVQK